MRLEGTMAELLIKVNPKLLSANTLSWKMENKYFTCALEKSLIWHNESGTLILAKVDSYSTQLGDLYLILMTVVS